ncbi:MAG: hypothetical protein M1833_000399 [Piccolia ochrophora]|nr:MAG: hypothetical protein M1833_000399 [Piccolia ochrophora]
MNHSALSAVKTELGSASPRSEEPHIKPEPDSTAPSPAALSDDDIYEDAGDLDFSSAPHVHLVRLPKWLWDNWSSIDEDGQIELGVIRVEDMGSEHKMSMLLHSAVAGNNNAPQEYKLDFVNSETSNTYLFTEKDLPGYSSRIRPRRKHVVDNTNNDSNKLASIGENVSSTQARVEKGKRWQPYFRRAIPKQTALAGVVKHEVKCTPVEVEGSRRVMEEMNKQAAKPKAETLFVPDLTMIKDTILVPGTLEASGRFGGFIKTGPSQRSKTQEQKAARIPQNELLDQIYECFKRYKFWSFKALKAQIKQPEAYLKSTLELVAELVKTGRFAMTWTLKAENQFDQYVDADIKEELAPEAGYEGDQPDAADGEGLEGGIVDDEEDEEDVTMEDVLQG